MDEQEKRFWESWKQHYLSIGFDYGVEICDKYLKNSDKK